MKFSRREFLKYSGIAAGASVLGMKGGTGMAADKSRVIFFQTEDRREGVKTILKSLKDNPVKGKKVLIKPNFNTADPTPGSTHNETLVSLVEEAWKMGAKSVSVGDRSFPPTLEVMDKKGILPLLEKLEVQVARIEYGKNWRIKPSRFDKILLSLESDFQTPEDVFEAEAIIEGKICGFLRAYEG